VIQDANLGVFLIDQRAVDIYLACHLALNESIESAAIAVGKLRYDKLAEFLANFELKDTIPAAIHDQLWELLREYLIVGGLPEAVKSWVETKSLINVNEIHHNLLSTYRDDFNKYAGRINRQRLEEVILPHFSGH